MGQGPALGFRLRTQRALNNPFIRRGRSSRGATVLTARQARSFRKRLGRGEDWANMLRRFGLSAERIERPGLWEDRELVERSAGVGAGKTGRVG